MEKEEFLNMELEGQIIYINKEMLQGKSLSNISKNIGISKSISGKLKNHNYFLDKDTNQYKYKQIEGQKMIFDDTEKAQEEPKQEKGITALPIKEMPTTQPITKAVGRPEKYLKDENGNKLTRRKLTIELDIDNFKALKLKKTFEDIVINNFVEELIKNAIDKKYFDMLKNNK